MKIIPCPLNGPRNASEFVCAGPVRRPPKTGSDDQAWTNYLFLEDNIAGEVLEWWCHVPSSYWFILERNTRTDEIIRSYAPDERLDLIIDGDENEG